MYRILLLSEEGEKSCRVKDYLQISGCVVREVFIKPELVYEELVRQADLVLLHCHQAERYFHVCEEVRAATQKPLLVLSDNDDEWAKIRMFQAGANDYLVEPAAQGEFIARVKGNIACYRRLTGTLGCIKIRDLEIEIFNRRVWFCGKEIKMTPREFDVLLFMAQNPEEVLSKDDIFHAIWNEQEGEGYYNCVAVYIKRLRKKLEPDPMHPQYIETVWGVGYRFRE